MGPGSRQEKRLPSLNKEVRSCDTSVETVLEDNEFHINNLALQLLQKGRKSTTEVKLNHLYLRNALKFYKTVKYL